VRLSALLHLSILAAVVSNAVYWQVSSLASAYVISVFAGAAYMTGTLIQLDLTARIIPARAAATIFATVMALTNFAGTGSEAFGGWLFETTAFSYGRETAFSLGGRSECPSAGYWFQHCAEPAPMVGRSLAQRRPSVDL